MITLRCTARLLGRLRADAREGSAAGTAGSLGDWHGILLGSKKHARPELALFVNDNTDLGVVVPAAPSATLLARFRRSAADVLRAIGVDEADVQREFEAMSDVEVASVTDAEMPDPMSTYAALLDSDHLSSWFDLSVRLTETPSIRTMTTARTRARALFGLPDGSPRRGSPKAILEAMRRWPPLEPGSADELMAAIESGRLPATTRGLFDDLCEDEDEDEDEAQGKPT